MAVPWGVSWVRAKALTGRRRAMGTGQGGVRAYFDDQEEPEHLILWSLTGQ